MNSLQEILNNLPFDPQWLTYLAIISIITFLLSLVLIPWLIAILPEDYFVDEKRHVSRLHNLHPLLYYLLRLIKNISGIILIIAGVIMLVLPGQGILTILVGLGLVDFPGKFKLLRKIAKRPSVFKSMNWVRRKTNRKPLQYPV